MIDDWRECISLNKSRFPGEDRFRIASTVAAGGGERIVQFVGVGLVIKPDCSVGTLVLAEFDLLREEICGRIRPHHNPVPATIRF